MRWQYQTGYTWQGPGRASNAPSHPENKIHIENSARVFYLFGVLRRFQHCAGHITTGSWNGRGNQYIQFTRVLYCKLPTNGKQLPAFPLEAVPGIEPRPQRWEARVLPLCHHGPPLCWCRDWKKVDENEIKLKFDYAYQLVNIVSGHNMPHFKTINLQKKKKKKKKKKPTKKTPLYKRKNIC